MNEQAPPFRIKLKVDSKDCARDYEQESAEPKHMNSLLKMIIKEFMKSQKIEE